MPYYIKKNHPECKSGWAVVDDGDGYYGCHTTKKSAIDQAIAISLSDDEPFEGERAAIGELSVGDYVSWDVNDPEILAEVEMVSGQFALVRVYEYEDSIYKPSKDLMIVNILRLKIVPRPEFVVEKTEDELMEPDTPDSPVDDDVDDSLRAVNQEAPAFMRAAARRGLAYYEAGEGGDGLVDRTIREARLMASGEVSDDKWIRLRAWIARHLGDLDAPDARPGADGYPSAGVVAHLLWGSGPSKRAAERTLAYAERVVARIEADRNGERMNETVLDESRDRWVQAAWSIKARLEGLSDEARAIGKREVRTNPTEFEVREESDGLTIRGYAAVFNSPSHPLPFIETIQRGAFKKSLQSRNRIMLLWNHDSSQPLASNRNGSLRLFEDDKGLGYEARIANTQLGRDVAELVRTGVVDSMSFGFQVKRDSWSADGNTRTLEEVAVHEISLVSFPAYEGTAGTVSVREKRDIDADQLADSLMRLESGEELEPDQAALINEVVAKLTKTEEVQEVNGDILALKKKKLDLLVKGL